MQDDQGPESRRYAPLVVFLLVLAIIAWVYGLATEATN